MPYRSQRYRRGHTRRTAAVHLGSILQSEKLLQNNILPKHVLKRHIKIITNGKVVFDSNDYIGRNIPKSIQYTIKQYGYPKVIKSTNKTPLIYNITSVASSIFSSEEQQNECLESIKR